MIGMPRARTGRPTIEHCRGVSRAEAPRRGVVELGGHDCPPNDRSAHECRFPESLVRLVRRDGRRSLPIVLVIICALHHRLVPA